MRKSSHVLALVMVHCAQALNLSFSECSSANGCHPCEFTDVKFTNAPEGSTNWAFFRIYADPATTGVQPLYRLVRAWTRGLLGGVEFPCLPAFQAGPGPDNTAFDKAAEFYRGFYQPRAADFEIARSTVLTSFGSAADVGGFGDTENLVAKMDYAGHGTAYLDALSLPKLEGAYRDYDDLGRMYVSRSVFWKEYYKYQMRTATVMVFMITDAWLASKNCWEEMGWAATGDPALDTPPFRIPTPLNQMVNMVYLISDVAKRHYYSVDAGPMEFHATPEGGGVEELRMLWLNNIAEANVYVGSMPTVCTVALELNRKNRKRFYEITASIFLHYRCGGLKLQNHGRMAKLRKLLH